MIVYLAIKHTDQTISRRVNSDVLREHLSIPTARFLNGVNSEGETVGCVFMEKNEDNFVHTFVYTGTCCVKPQLQNSGFGRTLMGEVENYTKEQKCSGVKLGVIAGRTSLIEWYERQGIELTGESVPFPKKWNLCRLKYFS